MTTRPFPHTTNVVQHMSPRLRAVLGEELIDCESPLFRALGYDLLVRNAVEHAVLSQLEQETLEEHRERISALESKLPPIPRWSVISEASGLESQADESN